MGKKHKINPSSAVIGGIVLITVVGLVYGQISKSPADFVLHFNGYGLLSAISTAINIIVLIAILKIGSNSEDVSWFLLFLLAMTVYGSTEALQRFSLLPSGALFWEHFSGIGLSLAAPALFIFAKSYTQEDKDSGSRLIPLLGAGWAIVTFFDAVSGSITSDHPIVKFPWGYYSSVSPQPGWDLILIWISALTIGSLVLLIRFYLKTVNRILKRQALIYTLAILVPFCIAIVTDGVLPAINVDFPPLAMSLLTFSSALMFYGIYKYRLFRLSPGLLAENILNTMKEAVVVTRNDFQIETLNSEAERLFGVTTPKLNGIFLKSFFPDDAWQKVTDHVLGKTFIDEIGSLTLVNQLKQSIPVRIFSTSLIDGKQLVGYVFVISDITDITRTYQAMKSLEEQLKIEKASVENTVEIRTRELREAQERLKIADQMKSEFISITSHNLRTPLATLRGSVEMLKISPKHPKDQEKFISDIQESTKKLNLFIEDILTISSLESGGQNTMQPVGVLEVIKPLADEAKAMTGAKKISFNQTLTDKEIYVNSNTQLLRLAVRNLLENAIKFTPKGNVSLTVTSSGDNAIITVEDTGIGIDPSEIPKLFTKFHRGTNTLEYNYEGEGIGLFLTKLVVKESFGNIEVSSFLNKGSKFTIKLPTISNSLTTPNLL